MPDVPSDALAGRRASLDLLKVLCCLSVVLLHSIVSRVENVDGSVSWWLANWLNAAGREAVPVFFMISGALLLRKDIPSYTAYYRNVLTRYGIPLFGGLVVYKALAVSQGDPTPLAETVLYNFTANLGFHLWFMWTFLGLALVVPLLRPMVVQEKPLSLYCILWCVFCVLAPWLREAGIAIPFVNVMFSLFAGYFVLGYCLTAAVPPVDVRLLAVGIALSVVGTALLTAWVSLDAGRLALQFYEGPSPLIVIFAACTYKLFLQRFPGPSSPRLRAVSGATFTIYIYHVLALSLVSRLIGPTTLAMSVFVHTPLAFAACTLLYFAGRRVPYVRAFFHG